MRIKHMYLTHEDVELFRDSNLAFILSNRHGGVSNYPYDSMNLAYHVGDAQSNVRKNREILMQHPYMESAILGYIDQIHSNTIVSINGLHRSVYSYKGEVTSLIYNDMLNLHDTFEIMLYSADGIITNNARLACMIMIADCNPILFYAKKYGVYAILHAGRAGLCNGIIFNCMNILRMEYGISASDVIAFVGPSIRKCCYEISADLASDMSLLFGNDCIDIINYREAFYLDMIRIINAQFMACGIYSAKILDICTCCNDDYFSYRRDNCTGRFALISRLIC